MKTRPACEAYRFYPGDSEVLREMVAGFLREASMPAAPRRCRVVVAPHAGYVYSGVTAGRAYARLRGARPERIVLMGVSHQYRFSDLSIYSGDAFESPLGLVPLDRLFIEELLHGAESDLSPEGDHPHLREHTLEVQIPFVQTLFPGIPIVPILFGSAAGLRYEHIGCRIASLLGPDDLVVASTDLSHFLSEEEANAIDRRSIDAVLVGDVHELIQGLRDGSLSMCGGAAVVAALACATALGATRRSLLDYRTSAAVSQDYGRVVGYAAIAFEQDKEAS